MFPKPIALPAAAKMTPNLELKPEFLDCSISMLVSFACKGTAFFAYMQIFVTKNMAYIKFRKRVMMAVLIRSANIAPMIGTIRNGFTV